MKFTYILAALGAVAAQAGQFVNLNQLQQNIDKYAQNYDQHYMMLKNQNQPHEQEVQPGAQQNQAPTPNPPAQQLVGDDEDKNENLDKAKKFYAQYIEGAGEIGVGIFICFFGGPMITFTVQILLFLGITAGLYVLVQTVDQYPDFAKGEDNAVMIVLAVCVIIGAIATHFLSKKIVTKENILKLIGAAGAGFACFLCVAPIDFPLYCKAICVVIAGIAGMFLIRGNEGQIFSYGTGFMGAFMLMHGLGQFLGGWPALSTKMVTHAGDQTFDNKFFGYLAGIVILTIIGGRVQMRKVNSDSGDYMVQP